AVEINNTFYRMPRASVLEQWVASVPDDFRFVIKASRRITHFKRLNEPEEPLEYLLKNLEVMGEKLGAVLFQLPPNMRCDMERLQKFVVMLPDGFPAAFEFRHESWFNDDVYEVLKGHDMALCHADAEEDELPFVSTTNWGYLRLRKTGYEQSELEDWMQKTAGWRDAFVFFKHEDEAAGPRMANHYLQLAGEGTRGPVDQ
ncbi:MAG: DUF72 domain-containing protein, partial [Pseudomonadota bacterium]